MKKRPTEFYIETVVGCNLSCPECALSSTDFNRKKQHMTLENYKVIVDKIKQYAKTIHLFIWGEPLLNKNIVDMIQYNTDCNIYSSISTNANLITDDMAKGLVNAGLNQIEIAIDGYSQEVYKKTRRNGNIKKVYDAISSLQKYGIKDKRIRNGKFKPGKKPAIICRYIVFDHNEKERDEFVKFCDSLNIKYSFTPSLIINFKLKESNIKRFNRTICSDLKCVQENMRGCGTGRRAIIFINGDMSICCFDYNMDKSFGNIFEKGFNNIWQSRIFKEQRRYVSSCEPNEFCIKNCQRFAATKEEREKSNSSCI